MGQLSEEATVGFSKNLWLLVIALSIIITLIIALTPEVSGGWLSGFADLLGSIKRVIGI